MSLENKEVKRTSSPIFRYLGGVMAVLFFFGGTAILFKHEAIEASLGKGKLGPYPTALGIVLMIYGIVRGYRVFRPHPTPNDD
jgi:hypothetical protein